MIAITSDLGPGAGAAAAGESRQFAAMELQERANRLRRQIDIVASLYDELDKLTRQDPVAPVSGFALRLIADTSRASLEFVSGVDPIRRLLGEEALNAPIQQRDARLLLRQLLDALERRDVEIASLSVTADGGCRTRGFDSPSNSSSDADFALWLAAHTC
jgi:hypothetical protein